MKRLPGDRRKDIDFHPKRQRTYGLEGTIAFSDDAAPKQGAFYFQDMLALRSDHTLTSPWLGHEQCQNVNNGTFRCDYLPAAENTFYFRVSAEGGAEGNFLDQAAKVVTPFQ